MVTFARQTAAVYFSATWDTILEKCSSHDCVSPLPLIRACTLTLLRALMHKIITSPLKTHSSHSSASQPPKTHSPPSHTHPAAVDQAAIVSDSDSGSRSRFHWVYLLRRTCRSHYSCLVGRDSCSCSWRWWATCCCRSWGCLGYRCWRRRCWRIGGRSPMRPVGLVCQVFCAEYMAC